MLSWVLLILAASAAATLIDPTVPVFSHGKEYLYRYETQILTGIPEVAPQYSAMKIKTECRIQFLETNLVTMKVENVKIYILNGDAIDVPPTTIIPDRLLTEMPSETAAVMIESLNKPIQFKYEKGLVHEIHAIEEDPFWSVNIKRGILNLININLTPDRVMEDREPSVLRDIFIKERKLSIDHAYKVKELGIYGECIAVYGIMDKLPIPISHTKRFLHVTKVVDTDTCEFSNIFEQGIFAGLTYMPHTPGKRPIIMPSIISDYILGGDRHRYWIKEAYMVATYSFRPSMKGMTAMEGFVKQEMRFIEVSDVMQPLRLDRPMVEVAEGLSLRMPTQVIPDMEPTHGRTPEMDPVENAKKVELAEAILENLITKLMVPMALDEECVLLVKRLTLVLRVMPKMELKNIISKYILPTLDTPVTTKKKAILMDILPTLPHPDLIEIMKMLIERRVIAGPSGAMKISMMTLIMHPTPRIIEELLTVCELPVVKSDVILRRSLMLGAGTMIHKMSAFYRKIGVRSRVTIRAFEPIITKMREILRGSSTADEKMLWIKMVGNAGVPELMPEVMAMIVFIEYHDIGYGIQAGGTFRDPENVISIQAKIRILAHIFGTPLHLMEGKILTKGLAKIMKVLLGPNGILRPIVLGRPPMDWSTLFNPESGPPSTGVVAEELMTILSRLDLPTILDEEMSVGFDFSLFGQELNYVSVTMDDIKRTIINMIHRDCKKFMTAMCSVSGVYTVTPRGGTPTQVYCDMDTTGGGWLVFQKRVNGSVDFNLNWASYAAGFGDLNGEFWLGNRNLHLLTAHKNYTLRVELSDWEGNQRYAQYSSFTIDSEQDKFRLTLGSYSGDSGDGLSTDSGMQFSTSDQDNDQFRGHCAQGFSGGWWYRACGQSSLNGRYYIGGPYTHSVNGQWEDGVWWYHWKGLLYSHKTTRLMIRPAP